MKNKKATVTITAEMDVYAESEGEAHKVVGDMVNYALNPYFKNIRITGSSITPINEVKSEEKD